ncbi:bifunctional Kelch-type beta propeller/Calcineurin-like phosphoesterase domain [Babesia duncani]|uniref:Serine/threonine-protein phosphatase n=1 Tax=Babesia duncani TaxID=323732 RepID=A0AAD9PPA5_9APIC|nr:bifunctional Kelch-type beta propeller/Calcineurin-like phosphoesterase domain [Babesia duncani]
MQVVVFGGATGGGALSSDELYLLDLRRDKQLVWITVPTTGRSPGRRYGHTMVFSRPNLIVIGGNDGQQASNDVWFLNVEASPFTWVEVSFPPNIKRPPKRVYHSADICKEGPTANMVVIFGGRTSDSKSLNDIWGLRQHRDGSWDWTEAPIRLGTVPESRYQHSASFIGTKLVIVGGRNDNEINKPLAASVYDTETLEWTNTFSVHRFRHSCWSFRGQLYVFGGFSNQTQKHPTSELLVVDFLGAIHSQHSQASAALQAAPKALELDVEGGLDKVGVLTGSMPKPVVGFRAPEREIRLSAHAHAVQDSISDFALMVRKVSIDKLEDEGKKINKPEASAKLHWQNDPMDALHDRILRSLLNLNATNDLAGCMQRDGIFPIAWKDINTLCQTVYQYIKQEPTVLKLRAPIKVYGDIHGQYYDLMRLFRLYKCPLDELVAETFGGVGDLDSNDYLFLGDYVDRGSNSLEVIILLFALKCKYPTQIHLLRGNHEDPNINALYGFQDECQRRLREDTSNAYSCWQSINRIFEQLPLGAVIEGKILCLHGGIGKSIHSVHDIEKIQRPVSVVPIPACDRDQAILDILWSDPTDSDAMLGTVANEVRDPEKIGHIVKFGPDRVHAFLTSNDLQLIISLNKMATLYKNSARSLLALLEESNAATRVFGLEQLDKLIDEFWPEAADGLDVIEHLYEDSRFVARELAALVASKIYYHLEQYPMALQYALAAGSRFNINKACDYTHVIVAKAVAEYIALRLESQDAATPRSSVRDLNAAAQSRFHLYFSACLASLESLVERLLRRSIEQGQEEHAIGIAIESRRMDLVQEIFAKTQDKSALLKYVMAHVGNVLNFEFKRAIYAQVALVIGSDPSLVISGHSGDYCTSLYQLGRVDDVALLLERLVTENQELVALQLAYDLVDMGDVLFTRALLKCFPQTRYFSEAFERLRFILGGASTNELYLQFLHEKNATDVRLLEHLVSIVDQRSSILHSGLVVAHGLMQAGTCCDVFLRNNLQWFAKANNWAKFSATASIGLIHKGFINQYKKVLSAYLPTDGGSTGSHAFSEGGSLYALGLMHSNLYDESARDLLMEWLGNEHVEEPITHGAALGLGLVCLGRADMAVYEHLQTALYKNNAVSGQGAAIGIGMLMVGTNNQTVLEDLYKFMNETEHEKITRACGVAIAMVLMNAGKEAMGTIAKLAKSDDALVRYGGMFCYAMAFCGTSSSKVIREMLSVAVSDVCNDTRRAAVISLGFIMCNEPDQVPQILKLLAGSYNSHVRYGVTIALGIACAGSANPDALSILHALAMDKSDLVKQGALVSLGLLLQTFNSHNSPNVPKVREMFKSMASDKHQDMMARFGAIIGMGLMDAGGQNCISSLYTRRGNLRAEAIVGFCMFAQYWYWHPFIHIIGLTLQPTCFIAVNHELKVPKTLILECDAPAHRYGYVERYANLNLESKRENKVTAVLSVSAKRDAWRTHHRTPKRAPPSTKMDDTVKMDEDLPDDHLPGDPQTHQSEDMGNEPCRLENPCRVVVAQVAACRLDPNGRYVAAIADRNNGIVVVHDRFPNEPMEYMEQCARPKPEAPPFTPFEWSELD